MKMICNVPDEVIKSVRMGTWCGSSVVEKMIANGTPIPDNAINGQVMQTLFKPTRVERTDDDVIVENYDFNEEWWSSPYQKGGTNEKQV